jgi:hypothetical protein
VYQALMQRFGALGQEAAGLSAHVQELFTRTQQAPGNTRASELVAALHSVNEQMTQVAETARSLAEDAEAQGFPDVGRDAESLRQQLLGARNKANLLQQKLHPASA